jgi:methionyl-tRNA formyltransferase
MRVVFMGSPEFSVPTLRALHAGFEVVGVITQPDKPKGRGRKTVPTPVKVAALELGLPVAEPSSLSARDTRELLRSWNPDVIVVAAYGKILPRAVLNLPRMGCVNLHASLLPRHRGASPVSAAIMAGDEVTGVTTILMDEGTDTGDIILKREIPIKSDDTAGSLHDRLLEPGAQLVVETLRKMMDTSVSPVPQDHAAATYTRLLTREDGRIDWSMVADYLSRLVRAVNPWPGAFFKLGEEAVKVWEALPEEGTGDPGRLAALRHDGIVVGTGKGLLVLRQVQAPGKSRMKAAEFARGRRLEEGDMLE